MVAMRRIFLVFCVATLATSCIRTLHRELVSPEQVETLDGRSPYLKVHRLDGTTHIREINRNLEIQLPSEGPRTLNGLILEHMEIIPEAGTSLKINGYPIEIMQVKNNMVKTARISSPPGGDSSNLSSEPPPNG